MPSDFHLLVETMCGKWKLWQVYNLYKPINDWGLERYNKVLVSIVTAGALVQST